MTAANDAGAAHEASEGAKGDATATALDRKGPETDRVNNDLAASATHRSEEAAREATNAAANARDTA